ncbi:protoporphyrinogen oxidase [Paenibacillus algicola]|uniref:Coproporphyrinogen III oxidase n=1 Tax=Paenibacillus algicola TaxID=2565926 RepID=A0A4P8XR82_9BACL|nr:protoporphyrinogen oxidase [Paenibacillus algicola]QCT02979.1 protoporphyrinogen oxidase [Paenibacillus algicola]
MTTTVVIGGGITGLSTCYYLQRGDRPSEDAMKLILVEAEPELGGKIRTVYKEDFIMETGADSIVARKSNVLPFIQELGLEDAVVYNGTGTSYIYTNAGLKKIPADSLFGIPVGVQALVESELVSSEGKLEALKDLYTPNEVFTKDDSLGLFLEAFLGQELVEKQIAPVISGVYSGQLQDLTIASTLPFLLDYKNQYGSIMQGLYENRKLYLGAANKKFISFQGGMSFLIQRLEERLSSGGAIIYKGVAAESMEASGQGYKLRLSDGSVLEADQVVLSGGSAPTQALLQDRELDEMFQGLLTKSMISIYLAFDIPDHRLPSDGTGFINASEFGLICDASTWSSRKWEHTSKSRRLLVRLFYKSSNPQYDKLRGMSDQELEDLALQDVTASLGLSEKPVEAVVTRWQDNMPNYHLEHRRIVEKLEAAMQERWPGVYLAGCSYYGVGIPDCILNGQKTAQQLLDLLSAQQS